MIHNRIATIRTERGMSRKTLAAAVGINFQTVGFIERGDYLPSLELAFAIADALAVSITDVFSDKPFTPLFGKGA